MSEREIHYDETGEIVSADTVPTPSVVKTVAPFDTEADKDTSYEPLSHETLILRVLAEVGAQRRGKHEDYPEYVIYVVRNAWYQLRALTTLGIDTCVVPQGASFPEHTDVVINCYIAVKWLQVRQ